MFSSVKTQNLEATQVSLSLSPVIHLSLTSVIASLAAILDNKELVNFFWFFASTEFFRQFNGNFFL